MFPELLHGELTGVIRQTAFEVHSYFGFGFLEKVYENALATRLQKKGLSVAQQQNLIVRDEDGTIVGDYYADLIVEALVIVEIKAASQTIQAHEAQTIHYLRATGMRVALLLNFGGPRLHVRRLVLEKALENLSAPSAPSAAIVRPIFADALQNGPDPAPDSASSAAPSASSAARPPSVS